MKPYPTPTITLDDLQVVYDPLLDEVELSKEGKSVTFRTTDLLHIDYTRAAADKPENLYGRLLVHRRDSACFCSDADGKVLSLMNRGDNWASGLVLSVPCDQVNRAASFASSEAFTHWTHTVRIINSPPTGMIDLSQFNEPNLDKS